MVSLLKRGSRWVIQLGVDRGRLTIPLGAVSKAAAETVRTHVRHLERAAATQTLPPAATAAWLDGVSEKIHAKLAVGGLAQARAVKASHALGKFLGDYIDKRTDLKERTRTNLKQAKGKLVAFFGAGRDLTSITPGEAADWRRKLAETLEQPTVAMHVKKARQFFADAASRRIISENPFAKVKAGSMSNDANKEYVTAETIYRVIEACPDAEWRALFAMARWGTLRIKSEMKPLKWSDMFGFAADRIVIHSPKTEHHEGGGSRIIPMFPEVKPYLLDLFELADDKPTAVTDVYVFARLRHKFLVSQAWKIIDKAKVPRWKKLWQNLRSSCQTDLEARHPSHVVCAWMGNTEAVARKHYLQVTDADYERAALGAALASEHHRTSTANSKEKAPVLPGRGSNSLPPRGARPKQPFSMEAVGGSRPALRRALRKSKEHSHPLVHKANVAALRSLAAPRPRRQEGGGA